jgi:hypothetical protein
MPGPSREQFDAAAKKVAATAPAGLSRDDFFNLVDSELKGTNFKSSLPPAEHESQDYGDSYKGPDSYLKGFTGSVSKGVLDATVNNPALQGAAHPQGLGDILGLVIPDANIAGKAIQGAISKAPRYIEKAGDVLANAGRASRGAIPYGLLDMMANPKVGAAIAGAPIAAEGAGNVIRGTGRILGRELFKDAAPIADRYMPNVSSAVPEAASTGGRAAAGVPSPTPFEPTVEGLDRYMPNSSDATAAAGAPSDLSRVPYSTPTPTSAAPELGRLTGNKAAPTEDVLADALSEALGPEQPTQVSGGPSALSQTPTGRPAVTAGQYDEIQASAAGHPSTEQLDRAQYNIPDEAPAAAPLEDMNARGDAALQKIHDDLPTENGMKVYNPGGSQEQDIQDLIAKLHEQYPGESRITPETPVAGTPDAGASGMAHPEDSQVPGWDEFSANMDERSQQLHKSGMMPQDIMEDAAARARGEEGAELAYPDEAYTSNDPQYDKYKEHAANSNTAEIDTVPSAESLQNQFDQPSPGQSPIEGRAQSSRDFTKQGEYMPEMGDENWGYSDDGEIDHGLMTDYQKKLGEDYTRAIKEAKDPYWKNYLTDKMEELWSYDEGELSPDALRESADTLTNVWEDVAGDNQSLHGVPSEGANDPGLNPDNSSNATGLDGYRKQLMDEVQQHMQSAGGDNTELANIFNELDDIGSDPEYLTADRLGELEARIKDAAPITPSADTVAWKKSKTDVPGPRPSRAKRPSSYGSGAMQQGPGWHSGAEPGSADAKAAETLHRSQPADEERLKHLWFLDELGK